MTRVSYIPEDERISVKEYKRFCFLMSRYPFATTMEAVAYYRRQNAHRAVKIISDMMERMQLIKMEYMCLEHWVFVAGNFVNGELKR